MKSEQISILLIIEIYFIFFFSIAQLPTLLMKFIICFIFSNIICGPGFSVSMFLFSVVPWHLN